MNTIENCSKLQKKNPQKTKKQKTTPSPILFVNVSYIYDGFINKPPAVQNLIYFHEHQDCPGYWVPDNWRPW